MLAQANVSFAFAHGAAVSKSAADAIVLSERLSDVADAHGHASRTMRVVRQNLAWAAIYNAACIPLALAGHAATLGGRPRHGRQLAPCSWC